MAATAKKTLREVQHIVACLAPKPDVSATIRKLPPKAPPMASTPSVPVQPEPPASLFAAAPRSEQARPRVEQLSEARHKVQLTVSSETREKLERARDLMKHRNPSGDLEVVFDRAMDALLEKLEKERLAKTSRPQKAVLPSKPGNIPAAARREVFARDGEQCTYVDRRVVVAAVSRSSSSTTRSRVHVAVRTTRRTCASCAGRTTASPPSLRLERVTWRRVSRKRARPRPSATAMQPMTAHRAATARPASRPLPRRRPRSNTRKPARRSHPTATTRKPETPRSSQAKREA